MVESKKPSTKYDPSYFSGSIHPDDGSRKIVFVLVNESD